MAILASDIMATTLPQVDKELADNISESNPLMKHLKQNGKIVRIPGGYELTEDIIAKPNKNGSWFKGAGYLRTGNNDEMVTARFNWKNYNINVTITGEDEMKNGDSEWRKHNLVKTKLNDAKITATNTISKAMYNAASTDEDAILQLTGIAEIVSKANPIPDTTFPALSRSFTSLGGITPNNDELDPIEKGYFWTNYYTTATAADLLEKMEYMYMALSKNNQKPDIIVCAPNSYYTFEKLMLDKKYYVETNTSDPSFVSIRYKGIPVFFDNNCTPNTIYMLNTNYLFFKVHTERFFNYEPVKHAPAQDVKLFPLYFMGNFTCSGRQFQGRIQIGG